MEDTMSANQQDMFYSILSGSGFLTTTQAEELAEKCANSVQHFTDDQDPFPVLYENRNVVIYTNGSNEIFIKEKNTLSEMRMNFDNGIQFTAQGHYVEPYSTATGLIGWRVKKRK
jgi:hypothetical protein